MRQLGLTTAVEFLGYIDDRRLTDAEIALLRAFTGRMGEVLSRDTLCKIVGSGVNERAIDVQVTRLRRKIEPDPGFPRYLRTVRGQGYRLVDA